MHKRIPCVVMRGGTSRALFFHDKDLPDDKEMRDAIFLSAVGSPDPTRRQVDGLGGGVSSTSKVAVIAKSTDPRYDVVYHFGQVAVDRPFVDYLGNCGNISSAVAPFAIDEGLVPAGEGLTSVRIHQRNTDKLIVADVQVQDGRFVEDGDFSIPGVRGTGSRIALHFMDPGGTVTGRLLPTGKVVDQLEEIPQTGTVAVSIVDAGNPIVFVAAEDLGIDAADIDCFGAEAIATRLESIRAKTAVMLGFAATEKEAGAFCQAVPKIAVVTSAREYKAMNGSVIHKQDFDILIRCMSMGGLHKAVPGTAAICAAGAARITGTVVNRCLSGGHPADRPFHFGHPSGIMPADSEMTGHGGDYHYKKSTIYRTARRIMEGDILIPAGSR